MNKKLLVALTNMEQMVSELAPHYKNNEEWQFLMVLMLKNLYRAQRLLEDLK